MSAGGEGRGLALAHRGALVDYVRKFQPRLWELAGPAGLSDLCAGRLPPPEFLRRIDGALGGAPPGQRDELRRGAQRILTLLERLPRDPAERGPRPLLPGDRVGPYTVLAELGRGGMGVVFACRDARLDREVALKQISGLVVNPRTRERFAQEAQAVARLHHPGIVKVLDVGEHEGTPYVVMDLVRGRSLQERLEQDGPLPPPEAATIIREVALALVHAHEQQVLHRDVKPDNVLVTPEGQPVLIDFGVAKVLDGQTEAALTRTGQLLGTPAYMAPEQTDRRGRSPDGRADVYGLGATLYALLCGQAPFDEDTLVGMLAAVASRVPDPPSQVRAGVPADLDTIALRCLEKDPARRYPSAQALADDLQAFLEGRPIGARRARSPLRRGRGGLVASALVVLGVTTGLALCGGAVWWGQERGRAAERTSRSAAAAQEARLARSALGEAEEAQAGAARRAAALRALRAAERWRALEPASAADEVCARAERLLGEAPQAEREDDPAQSR